MDAVNLSIAILEQNAFCCCCWEFSGERSKFLSLVNSTIEGLKKLSIYPEYSLEICDYPIVVFLWL